MVINQATNILLPPYKLILTPILKGLIKNLCDFYHERTEKLQTAAPLFYCLGIYKNICVDNFVELSESSSSA
jgi:hypothetical protein